MRKTNLIKIVSVLLITLLVGIYASNVYAAEEGEDIFDSLQGSMNESNNATETPAAQEQTPATTENQNKDQNKEENKEANTSIYNNTTNTTKENLPNTGLENTLPIVALITVAGISAIFAYKKVREYSNI